MIYLCESRWPKKGCEEEESSSGSEEESRGRSARRGGGAEGGAGEEQQEERANNGRTETGKSLSVVVRRSRRDNEEKRAAREAREQVDKKTRTLDKKRDRANLETNKHEKKERHGYGEGKCESASTSRKLQGCEPD